MPSLANRVKMTTATTGTGTLTLGSAVTSFQSFADGGILNGDVVFYVIEQGADWEIGTGTYTSSGTTMSRTVAESSNADAPLNLNGTAQVYITPTLATFNELARTNAANTFTATQTFAPGSATAGAQAITFTGNTNAGIYAAFNQIYFTGNGINAQQQFFATSNINITNNAAALRFGSAFDTIITRRGAANLRFGDADVANDPVTPAVAQTLSVQGVATDANNTNRPGYNFTIAGSQGTGSGAGGSIIFRVAPAGGSGTTQNALVNALTINSASTATFAGLVDNRGALNYIYTGNSTIAIGSHGSGPMAGLALSNGAGIVWTSSGGAQGGSVGLALAYDAANTLALRNGAAAQTFNVYNTTDGTNSEFLQLRFNANVAEIRPRVAGTGTNRELLVGYFNGAGFQFGASNATCAGNLIFSADSTFDIGASGASRPRNVFVAGSVAAPQFRQNGSSGAGINCAANGSRLVLASNSSDVAYLENADITFSYATAVAWAPTSATSGARDLVLTRRGPADLRHGATDRTIDTIVTITIAAPGVVTLSNHLLSTGSPVVFATTGALPTGITAGVAYYAIVIDANSFSLATTFANALAGTALTTSGTQSGTQTATRGPVAQALSVQSVIAGVSNFPGADTTFNGSQSTGSATGGSFVFRVSPAGSSGNAQNALETALTINSLKQVVLSAGLALENYTSSSQITIRNPNGPVTSIRAIGNDTRTATMSFNNNAIQLNSTRCETLIDGTADHFVATNSNSVTTWFRLASDGVANTLALRNSTNAQTFRVYNSFTDASNYSRLAINANQIRSEVLGTGSLAITASAPILDLAQTWNNAGVTFTALKLNVTDSASAAASLLMDLQLGGASKFNIDGLGRANIRGTDPQLRLGYLNESQFIINQGILIAGSGYQVAWSSSSIGVTTINADLILTRRGAANLRLGAADAATPIAQTLSVQGRTGTDAAATAYPFTIQGAQGTGTGAGGSIVFQVAPAGTAGSTPNAFATALTIDTTLVTSSFKLRLPSSGVEILGPSSGTVGFDAYNDGSACLRFTVNSTAKFVFNSNLGALLFEPSQYIGWNGLPSTGTSPDVVLGRRDVRNLRLGAPDAATALAQTFSVQSVVAGTTDGAGANFTITGSQGTGAGAGGSIIFRVAPAGSSGSLRNAFVTALTINGSSQVVVSSSNLYADIAGSTSNANSGIKILGGGGRLTGNADTLLSWDFNSASAPIRIGNGLGFGATTQSTIVADVLLTRAGSGHLRHGAPDAGAVAATVTITIAAPGVITWTTHTLSTGTPVVFTTTGALPTGIVAGTTYYVVAVDANTFQIASSVANAIAATPTVITTSGTQSGVHTATRNAIVQRSSVQSVTGVTDRPGADRIYTGSQGTGTGIGGSHIFQVAPAGSTGSAQNALVNALTLSGDGSTFTFGPTTITDHKITRTSGYSTSATINLDAGGNIHFSATIAGNPAASALGNDANPGLRVSSTGAFSFSSTSATNGAADVLLRRDAANVLALRNGAAAQTFNVYNTFTDASNYERARMSWSGNILRIGTEALGTGNTGRIFELYGASIDLKGPNGSGYARFLHANTPTFDVVQSTGKLLRLTPLYVEFDEVTTPSAPIADKVRIYAEDNGSGKTRLMAIFATGVAQQIAIEP